jgi:sec-independent protein translocase protein TatB
MFDLSFAEVLLIVVVTVIFIGPKDLPVVVRAIARAMRSMRSLASELKQAFDELGKESGIQDVTDTLNEEVRLIKGDDGQFYEAHDVEKLPGREKHHG